MFVEQVLVPAFEEQPTPAYTTNDTFHTLLFLSMNDTHTNLTQLQHFAVLQSRSDAALMQTMHHH
jgi:hypothetical protein